MVRHVLGHMALDEFTKGPSRELVEVLVEMYQNEGIRPERIAQGEFGDALANLYTAVTIDEHEASENWAKQDDISVPRPNDKPYKAAESAMKLLKLDRVNEAIDQVREHSYVATQEGNEEKMQRLQQKMMSLQELRKRIEKGAFLED